MAENRGERGDYSKHRDPQSRKPYAVWWQGKHVAPHGRLWRTSGEIRDQSRPKLR